MNHRIPILAISALALAACATDGGRRHDARGYETYEAPPPATQCYNCGTVERIETVQGDRHTTGTGAVLGGVVGGVLGNQVGKGNGRTAATIAGAAAGAVVGNEIEKKQNGTSYDLYVRMDDGRKLIVNQNDIGSIREGSYVSVENNRARLVR